MTSFSRGVSNAMRARIADSAPDCLVSTVDDFVSADNVAALVPADALVIVVIVLGIILFNRWRTGRTEEANARAQQLGAARAAREASAKRQAAGEHHAKGKVASAAAGAISPPVMAPTTRERSMKIQAAAEKFWFQNISDQNLK